MFPVSSSLPRLYSLWYRNLSLQSDDFFLYGCALLLTAPLIISAAQDQGYGLLFWLMKSCNSHLVAVYFFLSFPPAPLHPAPKSGGHFASDLGRVRPVSKICKEPFLERFFSQSLIQKSTYMLRLQSVP